MKHSDSFRLIPPGGVTSLRVLLLVCWWCWIGSDGSLGQELVPLNWPTTHGSPPPVAEGELAKWLPSFRLGLIALPESAIVALVLSEPALLGLPAESAAPLQALLEKRYAALARDELYARAPSALPYCFAARAPSQGYALLYRPKEASAQTPVILFLHGSGGSFLWYQHFLTSAFPDHIVLAPAYGIDPSQVPPVYLREALAAAEQQLGFRPGRVELMGLSAGGFGICRVFAADPAPYASLTVLAAFPPPDTLGRLRGNMRFLAGAKEIYVQNGTWKRESLRVPAKFALIPGADHFFLATHPIESERWLKAL